MASARSPRAIAIYHSIVRGKSASRLKLFDARRQRPGVVAWRVAPASSVGAAVAVGQPGEVGLEHRQEAVAHRGVQPQRARDRKSTRLNSSHGYISYAVFCLKKKKKTRATGTWY